MPFKLNYLRILLLLLLATVQNPGKINAQESIGFAYNYGNIVIHSPGIESLIKGPVKGFTINYALPNRMGEAWRKNFNYPNYGISYNFKNYGNPEILGNSHSITAFLQLSFLRHRSIFDIGFKGFTGLGFFTKIYDPVSNPLNQAISSHINISTEGRFYAKLRIKPVSFEYSYGLDHSSNGLIKAPNLGINVLNNSFKVTYEFEKQADNIHQKNTEKTHNPGHEFWGFISIGIKEIENKSQKYRFSSLSLNYSKKITAINNMGIGMDLLNDRSLTPVAYQNYHYLGSPDLNHRYGINLHNEFIMGKLGLYTAYGFYMRKSEYYTSRDYYKVGFKFYMKNAIVLAMLRAVPLFRADVIEFGIGYRITDKKSRNKK